MLSNLRLLFKSPFDHGVAHKLYVTIVHQSRLPVFYDKYEVQDTPEGRFDLLAIHTYLVLRRLREEHEKAAELSQALFDLMFADLDQNLREMGYGDTGVAKRIRKMAEGFYGRINAYDEGLAVPDGPETETPGALGGIGQEPVSKHPCFERCCGCHGTLYTAPGRPHGGAGDRYTDEGACDVLCPRNLRSLRWRVMSWNL
ncbi:MAG: hypothetical protein HQ501_03695 [Rhodospirillales bacterium]|nr:hypothetical protein [Rhodospirillales bacterium]